MFTVSHNTYLYSIQYNFMILFLSTNLFMYFHVVLEWKIFSHVRYSCIHYSDGLLWITPDDLVVYFFEFEKMTLLTG